MAKKPKCPECPPVGAPEYMLTYGDMMTLLVTFFVLLLSFSSMQESKFSQATSSLEGALGVLNAMGTKIRVSENIPVKPETSDAKMKQINKLLKKLEVELKKANLQDKVSILKDKDKIHFKISNPMLFETAGDDLNVEATSALSKVADILKLLPNEIRIEGHTDSIPISTRKFRNNWELSSARALSVGQFLIRQGIDPMRLQVIGFGEFRPKATNETAQGRSINRRVDIFINLGKEKKESLLESEDLKLFFQ